MESRAEKLLVVQGRIDHSFIPKEQANLRSIAQKTGVELTFVNALSEKGLHPWGKPDAVLQEYGGSIWLGSSDFNLDKPSALRDKYLNRTMPLAEKILDEGENALGICLGHQVFANAGGEKVPLLEERQEIGTVRIDLTEQGQEDPLFAGLPSSIPILAGHNYSVEALPEGFTRLGSTHRDPNSVLRKDNVVTLQVHPELKDADDFKSRIEASKKTTHPYYETNPITSPHPETHTILVNFFEHVKKSTR